MLYRPLSGMKLYIKICDNFRALGHCAGFDYALAMVHSTGFGHVLSVPDHGRPNISGPIRSIQMYSWAQCTVQERLVCSGDVPCLAQEEQGFGPSPP